MANHRAAPRGAAAEKAPNRARNMYTLHTHTAKDGSLNILVGRCDPATQRYAFTSLGDFDPEVEEIKTFAQALRLAAFMIETLNATADWPV